MKILRGSAVEVDRKIEYYSNLVEEKNLNIQILQDELQALQLELLQTDERVKSLQTENQQLVQRWLSKVSETVEKLNAEVEQSSPQQAPEMSRVLQSTNIGRAIYGVTVNPYYGIIIPNCAPQNGDHQITLLHELDLHTELVIPRDESTFSMILSRDADICIGISKKDPEIAYTWSTDTGKLTGSFAAPLGTPFLDICPISSSNDAVVAMHNPNVLRLFDIPRSFCLWTETLECPSVLLSSLKLGNADVVAVLMDDGRIQLWDIRQRKVICKSSHQLPRLLTIASDIKSSEVIVCSERAIHVLDPSTLRPLRSITHQSIKFAQSPPTIQSIAISPRSDGGKYAALSKGVIVYGDYSTGTVDSILTSHNEDFTGLGWITTRHGSSALVTADSSGLMQLHEFPK